MLHKFCFCFMFVFVLGCKPYTNFYQSTLLDYRALTDRWQTDFIQKITLFGTAYLKTEILIKKLDVDFLIQHIIFSIAYYIYVISKMWFNSYSEEERTIWTRLPETKGTQLKQNQNCSTLFQYRNIIAFTARSPQLIELMTMVTI